MFRVTQWISSSFILVAFCGCASNLPRTEQGPREAIFYDDFDHVWTEAHVAIQKYPLKVDSLDKGLIETESIRDENLWLPPNAPEGYANGLSYQIKIKLLKGRFGGRPAVRVSIDKQLEIKRDFIDSETRSSDGLEESAILYRIGRELEINKALYRSSNKQ